MQSWSIKFACRQEPNKIMRIFLVFGNRLRKTCVKTQLLICTERLANQRPACYSKHSVYIRTVWQRKLTVGETAGYTKREKSLNFRRHECWSSWGRTQLPASGHAASLTNERRHSLWDVGRYHSGVRPWKKFCAVIHPFRCSSSRQDDDWWRGLARCRYFLLHLFVGHADTTHANSASALHRFVPVDFINESLANVSWLYGKRSTSVMEGGPKFKFQGKQL